MRPYLFSKATVIFFCIDYIDAEQMVEHHGMINQVNFEFNPNQFYIPEDLLKPKKTTKKVVKKKTVKKVQDEGKA